VKVIEQKKHKQAQSRHRGRQSVDVYSIGYGFYIEEDKEDYYNSKQNYFDYI
jgi:hypothetical protein